MRILVVAHQICRPDTASGDLRFSKILKFLAEFAEVDLLIPDGMPPSSNPDSKYWRGLKDDNVHFVDPIFYPNIDIWCKTRHYDWVIAEFYSIGELLLPSIASLREHQHWMRFAVDSVDVHFLRELGALSYETEANRTQEQILARKDRELATYRAADLVLVVTEEDGQALQKENVFQLATVHNIARQRERSTLRREKSILFVGGFKLEPNVDAILWFANDIFPVVLAQHPDAKLEIVGSHPPEKILELNEKPGISVAGFVEDTANWLDSAAVSIAPLRYGAGMKGKVTEAMSASVPVVTTTIGAQGLNAVSGEQLWIADTVEDFASGVINCLNDASMAEQVGRRGQDLVATICGEEVVRKNLRNAFCEPEPKQDGQPLSPMQLQYWLAIIICFGLRLLSRLGVSHEFICRVLVRLRKSKFV